MMWAISMTFDIEPLTFGRMVELEENHDAVAANVPGGVDVTLHESGDPVKAIGLAYDFARDVMHAEPVAYEITDEERRIVDADAPTLPRMVSAPEVGEMLGVSRQRVYQLQQTGGFPEPLFRLRTGPVWDAAAVEAFARTWDRRPGPKSKAS
ncbi:hypothetical protein MU582_18260 [Nocardioidaceae bacterium SCSIO 66511]|nr:hypothetical protein MU582_18260 [Nocardioidaceae bacterium SCSIO 66511]